MKPLARREGLLVRELGDETLVYDRERHEAHCLNRAAATVFRHCDGTRSPEEIAVLVSGDADLAAREAVVKLALEQLSAARLLAVGEEHGASAHGCDDSVTSRRELLRLAALAVPMIASIVAPTPAQAASGCINGSECTNPGNEGKRCASLDNGDCTTGFPTCCCNVSIGTCESGCCP